MLKELGIEVRLEKELCEPCVYGKAHRLSFGHREKASRAGELISADVSFVVHSRNLFKRIDI